MFCEFFFNEVYSEIFWFDLDMQIQITALWLTLAPPSPDTNKIMLTTFDRKRLVATLQGAISGHNM